MTWQILAAWLVPGLIAFFAIHWFGRNEPTDHGRIVVGQFALAGLFWPVTLSLFLLAAVLPNKEQTNGRT